MQKNRKNSNNNTKAKLKKSNVLKMKNNKTVKNNKYFDSNLYSQNQ